MFRSKHELQYHHRDVMRQKELLRDAFSGMHPTIDGWLEELDRTPTFYFDSITQLQLQTWSRGRVTLVGDAGYCPGPAVGGSTSLSVLGAYVLAGELAQADGDYARAFASYEQQMAAPVRRSRAFARTAAKTIVPAPGPGLGADPRRPAGLDASRRAHPGDREAQPRRRADVRLDAVQGLHPL